jgi:hypothetical protein
MWFYNYRQRLQLLIIIFFIFVAFAADAAWIPWVSLIHHFRPLISQIYAMYDSIGNTCYFLVFIFVGGFIIP